MVATAALMVMGSAHALWPADGLGAGASQFVLSPRLAGSAFVQCNGLSPASNACATGFLWDRCKDENCGPTITGNPGYTGTISAIIDGFACSFGCGQASVWKTCSYLAGSTETSALNVKLVGCSYGTNAPRIDQCYWDSGSGSWKPCYALWPDPVTSMLTLRGVASAPQVASATVPAPALGSWTVQVVH